MHYYYWYLSKYKNINIKTVIKIKYIQYTLSLKGDVSNEINTRYIMHSHRHKCHIVSFNFIKQTGYVWDGEQKTKTLSLNGQSITFPSKTFSLK